MHEVLVTVLDMVGLVSKIGVVAVKQFVLCLLFLVIQIFFRIHV